MSRLAVLRRHPKRTLSGLTVALVAIGVAVGSGASFSSSSANDSNVFTAGTLHHTNTAGGNSLVGTTLSNLKPGFGTTSGNTDTVDQTSGSAGYGSVVIANDGSLDGTFTASQTESSSAYSGVTPDPALTCGGTCLALDGKLKVKITATDTVGGTAGSPATVYNGLVSGVAAAHLGNGTADTFTLAAGDQRKYDAYFYLPTTTTGNAYQGGSATVNLAFAEAQ